ncbi:DNA repair protein RAD50 [Plasmodium inui San Antonio 1]|uniref:DNA repair protein RAD50 n=1 Tax=Plasmodium inui San Antonio 1 TaxID=1237626 RepID=W7ALX1_9APIC|nr:DNA repair protein RAD50 [Plasmodium inui San Antonio 1]EUD66326.1 DNA repair protein RAD50 [Plasmodium inui San Antonio 1]
MTTLEKIGIQGIRSYCDEEAQELEFASPITVIYGNNGSGKSTIIECLKMSCTGDFPPNADKGKSFIHDPLISNKMNIRGKINLMLKNYNNKRIGISRSFSLFYCKDKNKKIKQTFRALDNNIIIKKEKGQDDVIITNKCLDINDHIPKLMGVSKALLENVILCHHEESLWPFSESLKIKKKFDELFGDEHFSKILDEFTKCRKTMNDVLKRKEYELATLRECYDKKKNIALDIQRNEEEIEECQTIMRLDKEEVEESFLILNKLEKKKSLLGKVTSSIDMYFAIQEKFQDDLQNYKTVKEIYEEDASELEHFAELFQRDLAKCNSLIEQVSNEFALLEKQTCLPVHSCDEADVKERDGICSSLFHLEKRRGEADTLIKATLDLDNSSTANGVKRRHVGKNLSEERTRMAGFIKANEPIWGGLLVQWRALFGEKGPRWVFRRGRAATSVGRGGVSSEDGINLRGSSDDECSKNGRCDDGGRDDGRSHGEGTPDEPTPAVDSTNGTITRGNLPCVKHMRRRCAQTLALLRAEVRKHARERLHIRRKKKILTEKAKKWRRRVSKMDKRIATMEMHKDYLTNFKSSDESYKQNCNHLDKMNQLGCVYDSIGLSEANCGEKPSYMNDDTERKKEELKQIEQLNRQLEQVLLLGKYYEKTFEYFLRLRRVHRKVASFFDELRALLCELRKLPKVCRSIGKPSRDWAEEAGLVKGVDYGQECSTGEEEEKEEVEGRAERGGQDEDEKKDSNEEEHGEASAASGEIHTKPAGTKNLTKIVKVENFTPLGSPSQADSSKYPDREQPHGEAFTGGAFTGGAFTGETSTGEACSKRNKRMNHPGEEINNQPKRKNVLKMEPPPGQSYLTKLKGVISQYINKYDKKIKEVEKETYKLKKTLVLTSEALRDVSKRVGRYPDVLAQFLEMIEKKNFKSVKDFFVHFGQVRKDMRKIKMEMVALKTKEESLIRFMQHAEGEKACLMCKGPIADVALDGFTSLEMDKERKDIALEIEEKERGLTKFRGQKKELMILLGFYYKEVYPLHRDSASLSEIIDSLKKRLLDLQNGVESCSERIHKMNGKYQLMKILQERCAHLMESEMDIFCEKEKLDGKQSDVRDALSGLRQMLSGGKHLREALHSMLEFLEVGERSNGGEASDGGSSQKNLRHLLREFLPNVTLLCECPDVHFMMEKISAYMEDSCVLFPREDLSCDLGATFPDRVESKMHQVVIGEIKKDKVGKKYTGQNYTGNTKSGEEPRKEPHNIADHCTEYVETKMRSFCPQKKDSSVNYTKRREEKTPLLSNTPVYESSKCQVDEPNEMGTLESIAINNDKFIRAYEKLQMYVTLEALKKEQEIDVSVRIKSVIRERKEMIRRKTEEAQRIVEREKQIRESLHKAQEYIEKHQRRKNHLYGKEEAMVTRIKELHLRDKHIRRNIRRCRNDVVLQNKLYYVKVEMVKLLHRLVANIEMDMEKKKKELKKVEEKIHSNEIIQNESNELAKKLSQKKEQILSLQEEKINIEKMHHNVVINTNLKRMHERFLLHQRNFISSLDNFRSSFFSPEQKGEHLDTVNSMIDLLEEVYQTDCDIYKFVNESFSFLEHKRELLDLVYVEDESLRDQIEVHSKATTSLKMKEAEMKGKIELRKEYIDKLTTEMNSDTYVDIEKKYKKKIIEIFVYKNVIKDICNFYNSFDQAIIKFHSLKMQEINLSIRNLWRRVYNSADIDYIYIKSEVEMENNGKVQQRRSYNYRVVMVKDNCELDMKGRCSSGQKVLSSIIIRLALAESFSIKCGILALDEPTTNLDKSNSKNLASLIANIVDLRKDSSAFQLILITHDTHFVDVLSQYGLTNCFYRVRKNSLGYSTIVRVRQ